MMMTMWRTLTYTLCLAAIAPGLAAAQVRTIDPNTAVGTAPAAAPQGSGQPETTGTAPPATPQAAPAAPATTATTTTPGATYQKTDVLAAAEGVFGKGAEGLARMIEKILADQGEPTAYIAGREAGGAIAIGLRYGSGTLFHKIEGDQPVFWTGPSLGFDVGANGAKTFVLIYNLNDSADLFRSYPSAEGNLYVVGGLTASYLRRGDVVVIPIRLGVGWRLGANVGYMRFTKESRLLPF